MQPIPIPSTAMESIPPHSEWLAAQLEELSFWGDCRDTFGEEVKQLLYMQKMGFGGRPFDGLGLSFLDVGGGPTSILLKFKNLGRAKVIDPLPYPSWVGARYATAGIEYERIPAEEMDEPAASFDVGLMYNCLQHTIDPEAITRKLVAATKAIHIFEWIDVPPHPGHPHCLRAHDLEKWVGRQGRVEDLRGESGCLGRAWFI
jgi:2-polyprenyl-3-methyl-5-hydroxy-6-metoxy-1,4-benzoquinol methylase